MTVVLEVCSATFLCGSNGGQVHTVAKYTRWAMVNRMPACNTACMQPSTIASLVLAFK